MDQSFAYRVEQSEVVLPSDTEKLKIREGGDEITLLTCTPYGVNTHRLLVRAERTAYDFTEKEIGQVQKEKRRLAVGVHCSGVRRCRNCVGSLQETKK